MTKFLCLHCQRVIITGSKFSFKTRDWMERKCPFCGAWGGDIFSEKRTGVSIPKNAKHGDSCTGYEK